MCFTVPEVCGGVTRGGYEYRDRAENIDWRMVVSSIPVAAPGTGRFLAAPNGSPYIYRAATPPANGQSKVLVRV